MSDEFRPSSKPVDLLRTAGEAFVLLHQAVEDLSAPAHLFTLVKRERPEELAAFLRMAVRSAIITLYRLQETRENFLVPWLFTERRLKALGLLPIDELFDWKALVIVRGQYTGHVTSRRASGERPGQMIPADALGRAARKAGIWPGDAFIERTRSLVPAVQRVRSELARRHQHVMRFRNEYARTLREAAAVPERSS